jgi:hypothetical protein
VLGNEELRPGVFPKDTKCTQSFKVGDCIGPNVIDEDKNSSVDISLLSDHYKNLSFDSLTSNST